MSKATEVMSEISSNDSLSQETEWYDDDEPPTQEYPVPECFSQEEFQRLYEEGVDEDQMFIDAYLAEEETNWGLLLVSMHWESNAPSFDEDALSEYSLGWDVDSDGHWHEREEQYPDDLEDSYVPDLSDCYEFTSTAEMDWYDEQQMIEEARRKQEEELCALYPDLIFEATVDDAVDSFGRFEADILLSQRNASNVRLIECD